MCRKQRPEDMLQGLQRNPCKLNTYLRKNNVTNSTFEFLCLMQAKILLSG